MVTKNDYATREVDACRSVLLELMTILGEFSDNIKKQVLSNCKPRTGRSKKNIEVMKSENCKE